MGGYFKRKRKNEIGFLSEIGSGVLEVCEKKMIIDPFFFFAAKK